MYWVFLSAASSSEPAAIEWVLELFSETIRLTAGERERERRGWQERTKLKEEEEEEEVGASFVLLWRRRRVAGMEE